MTLPSGKTDCGTDGPFCYPGCCPANTDQEGHDVASTDASSRLVGGPDDGYMAAQYLWQTPYATVREWSAAKVAAIPEGERCPACKGTGRDVILASNGGVGEVVRCWPCNGTRRKGAR